MLAAVPPAGAQDTPSRPHVKRQGENLAPGRTVAADSHWSYFGDARLDEATSRTDDGSGSIKLVTPIPDGSMAFSDFIPIQGGRKYVYGFYIKTDNGPTHAGCQVSIHRSDKSYIRNIAGGRVSTSRDGVWEECALSVFVPDEAVFVRLQVFKTENTKPEGVVWADDFYLGEGIGLDQPPSQKTAFEGESVRVDELGNFEIKRDGAWQPFFPLCMYSDNYRDWSLYSRQGWNVIIWTGAASQVRQAKEAVSEFNPDGMLSGLSISQYTMPSGWAYNDMDDLRSTVQQIFDEGLGESLLMYYWDNEVHHEQWQVPEDVIRTIRAVDADATGMARRPVYALQGEYGIARAHATAGLVDVSGTYVGGGADATGGAGLGDYDGLFLLDRLEGQVSPAAFAQFNGVDGPGDMRLRLYNSIIMGAKAMGYWRDCYRACEENFMKSVGPVDEKPWWPDFPNLRREVDALLPIIRQPHWTDWTVTVEGTGRVRVGTRDNDGEGHLIIVNQETSRQTVSLKVSGLSYTAREVRDAITGEAVAEMDDDTFSIVLPAIGVGSGTRVVRLVASQTAR